MLVRTTEKMPPTLSCFGGGFWACWAEKERAREKKGWFWVASNSIHEDDNERLYVS
jgi:hypothetical protein